MNKVLSSISDSTLIKCLLSGLIYIFYGLILGIALTPSYFLLFYINQYIVNSYSWQKIIILPLTAGISVFVYFLFGTLFFAFIIRILTYGIQPGKYSLISFTTIRWLLYSGVYHLAGTTILNMVPLSFMGIIFIRIIGAKVGKNVYLNTWHLNDSYLLELGDNIVIGGKSDLSCHTVEKGYLYLNRIKIGSGTLIGQNCYISPGVNVGTNCTIGQYSFIRKNHIIPDNTTISAIAGLPIKAVMKIEKEFLP